MKLKDLKHEIERLEDRAKALNPKNDTEGINHFERVVDSSFDSLKRCYELIENYMTSNEIELTSEIPSLTYRDSYSDKMKRLVKDERILGRSVLRELIREVRGLDKYLNLIDQNPFFKEKELSSAYEVPKDEYLDSELGVDQEQEYWHMHSFIPENSFIYPRASFFTDDKYIPRSFTFAYASRSERLMEAGFGDLRGKN